MTANNAPFASASSSAAARWRRLTATVIATRRYRGIRSLGHLKAGVLSRAQFRL